MWWGVDPLAGEMPAWSSYTYTFQNPVRYIDPTGMFPEEGGDPPGSNLPVVFVTATPPEKKKDGPIKGISQAFGAIPELAKTFATNSSAILPSVFIKEERGSNFGTQQYETKGGYQHSLSNGQGGGTGFSPNGDYSETLDQLVFGAGAIKATLNPLKSIPSTFQYGVDGVDIGMNLLDALKKSTSNSTSTRRSMIEVGRVFYRNHDWFPANGVIDTVIDGHKHFSNGLIDSIAPLYFERRAYTPKPGTFIAGHKKPIN